MDDMQIIAAIRQGELEKPIRLLYKEYPKVEKLILKSGCSKQMAGEIFNDSLILLIEKVQSPDFVLTSKLSTYLCGINRFLAKGELKKLKKNQQLEWTDALPLEAADLDYDVKLEESIKVMENLLSKLSRKCQRIFHLFYLDKKPLADIAKEMGYSSTNSVKTQKYKCMERAHELARQNPDLTF